MSNSIVWGNMEGDGDVEMRDVEIKNEPAPSGTGGRAARKRRRRNRRKARTSALVVVQPAAPMVAQPPAPKVAQPAAPMVAQSIAPVAVQPAAPMEAEPVACMDAEPSALYGDGCDNTLNQPPLRAPPALETVLTSDFIFFRGQRKTYHANWIVIQYVVVCIQFVMHFPTDYYNDRNIPLLSTELKSIAAMDE